MRAVRASSRCLRSRRPATDAMQRLVRTANAPDTEIACPACPSLIRRSDAIGVSKLTGMNSDAISANAPSDNAKTAPHAAGRSSVWRSSVETCASILLYLDATRAARHRRCGLWLLFSGFVRFVRAGVQRVESNLAAVAASLVNPQS